MPTKYYSSSSSNSALGFLLHVSVPVRLLRFPQITYRNKVEKGQTFFGVSKEHSV